jgi:hypothetical protein
MPRRPVAKLTKGVNGYFTSDGMFAHHIFEKDCKKLLKKFENVMLESEHALMLKRKHEAFLKKNAAKGGWVTTTQEDYHAKLTAEKKKAATTTARVNDNALKAARRDLKADRKSRGR